MGVIITAVGESAEDRTTTTKTESLELYAAEAEEEAESIEPEPEHREVPEPEISELPEWPEPIDLTVSAHLDNGDLRISGTANVADDATIQLDIAHLADFSFRHELSRACPK